MVCNEHSHGPACRLAHPLLQPPYLSVADTSAPQQRDAGRVQSQNGDFAVGMERLALGCDVAPVKPKPLGSPAPRIVKGEIVIAGNHNLHPGQRLEEIPRLGEFLNPGMLDEIAGNGDDIRRELPHRPHEGSHCR